FTVTGAADVFFQEARLALTLRDGTNEVTLRLYDDAGGHPGTVLEAISLTGQMVGDGSVLTFASASHPLLTAGQTYWLLPLASTDTFAGWFTNNQGFTGAVARSDQPEPTSWDVFGGQLLPAFSVRGAEVTAAVPEPSGLALLGLGAAGLLAYARKRKA